MHLTRVLLRASHLAMIQSVITAVRDEKRALTERERDYLKSLAWPWWQWMMNHPEDHPPHEVRDRSEAFMDFIMENGYAEANREKLDQLCSNLWEGTDPAGEYLLGFMIGLRHRLLSQSSSFY